MAADPSKDTTKSGITVEVLDAQSMCEMDCDANKNRPRQNSRNVLEYMGVTLRITNDSTKDPKYIHVCDFYIESYLQSSYDRAGAGYGGRTGSRGQFYLDSDPKLDRDVLDDLPRDRKIECGKEVPLQKGGSMTIVHCRLGGANSELAYVRIYVGVRYVPEDDFLARTVVRHKDYVETGGRYNRLYRDYCGPDA